MRRIKGRGTKPEVLLERGLRKLGLRFKKQDALRPGKPDVSFPSRRLAVFVDGVFWHSLDKVPKTNSEFWRRKLERNVERDRRNDALLSEMGWTAIRLTDTDVNKDPAAAAIAVASALELTSL